MANQALFYLCELSDGDQLIVTWIDEGGAKVGANVQLLEEYDHCSWWKVEKVYPGPLPFDQLPSTRVVSALCPSPLYCF
jgi:hypothetical protein